ncbi:MAG: hypothetical protein WCY86_03025 [Spirosomataceae bacterium]
MVKWSQVIFVLALGFVLSLSACKEKKPPLSERIAKAWTAETVKHDNVIVYSRGGSNNAVPGYVAYLLILGSDNSVSLTEFDGNSFTGEWELQGETRLIIKNLGPKPPTNSGGVLEFTIKSIKDNELVLARVSPSTKTGNTVNEYVLTVR